MYAEQLQSQMHVSGRSQGYWIMIQFDMIKFDYKAKDAKDNWIQNCTENAYTPKHGIIIKHTSLPETHPDKYKYPAQEMQSIASQWVCSLLYMIHQELILS